MNPLRRGSTIQPLETLPSVQEEQESNISSGCGNLQIYINAGQTRPYGLEFISLPSIGAKYPFTKTFKNETPGLFPDHLPVRPMP